MKTRTKVVHKKVSQARFYSEKDIKEKFIFKYENDLMRPLRSKFIF